MNPGDVIGNRFRIDEVVGRGGFGVVYRVWDQVDSKTIALKTFLAQSNVTRALGRFRQEAQVWIALGAHPHLVQALFADEIEGRLYVGMEFIEPGPDGLNALDQYLREQPPDEEQSLIWAFQICTGMEYAGTRGIRCHRDLKPANIMIDQQNTVKISDFGLATDPVELDSEGHQDERRLTEKLFRGQTIRGLGFGTPTHMPPEQFVDAGGSDVRTDIYSVGVILYQMVTGELPVAVPLPESGSLEPRLRYWKAMEDAHRAFRMPDMASRLSPIIARCMQSVPSKRYPDFGALRGDLEVLLDSAYHRTLPFPVARKETTEMLFSRAWSLRRLKRWPEATLAYRAVLEHDHTFAQAWSGLGLCLGESGFFEEAHRCHLESTRLVPDSAEIHSNQGHTFLRAKAVESAEKAFLTALRLDEACSNALFGYSQVHLHRGEIDAALAFADQAFTLDPNDPVKSTHIGRVHMYGRQYTRALDAFWKAASRFPLHTDALLGKAVALLYSGKAYEAVRIFKEVDRQETMSARHRLAYAVALMETESFTRAERQIRRAEGAEPVLAALFRVRLLVCRREWTSAFKNIQAIAESALSHPVLDVQHALLYHLHSRNHEALWYCDRALATDPSYVFAGTIKCASLLRLGRDTEAIDSMLVARTAAPEDPVTAYNTATVLSVAGKTEEALEHIEMCLQYRPYWPDARFNHIAIRKKLGHTNQLLADYIRAAELESRHVHFWSRDDSAEKPGWIDVRDDICVADAGSAVQVSCNGWEPRHRNPELRPLVLAFPMYLPVTLTD